MIQTNDLPVVPLPDSPESGKAAFESLKGLSLDDAMTKIANSMVDFAFKLVIAILVFYVGRFIIRKLYAMVHKLMISRHVDRSLTTFVLSLVRMVLYFILIITIVGIIGLETSSFLAIFASAGVAIGMALSGTLQNFAGGVLILLLKPYKVGDYIEAQGYAGTVSEIQIFHTVINTPDNKRIIIPNGGLSTGSINNYSTENYRRVDWTVCLSYDTDYEAAAAAIKRILLADERVVVQYVEDDMARRGRAAEEALEEAREEAAAHGETLPDDEDLARPTSWWGRLTEPRSHKRKRLAKEVREGVARGNAALPKVDRAPFVGLNEMADSSINLTVRAWTHSSNYWGLYFDMNARFFTELPRLGFSFPFPQLDVHLDSPLSNDK
ncbi:MAG: mechanosensitive ion channel [Muribaculaceae bacterium]|nr:mechanosensitive ion channel [Muribaculaceae bacterium]